METGPSVQSRGERIFKYTLLGPAVIWVLAFTFFPIIAAVRYSFANYVLGEGITGWVGFDNYARLLTDGNFWYALGITALYVAITVPIQVCIGFTLAWLITIGLPARATSDAETTRWRGILSIFFGPHEFSLFVEGLSSSIMTIISSHDHDATGPDT